MLAQIMVKSNATRAAQSQHANGLYAKLRDPGVKPVTNVLLSARLLAVRVINHAIMT